MEFLGYKRLDGSFGIRNYVVVMPAVDCANEIAVEIAKGLEEKVIALPHSGRCDYIGSDQEALRRTLVGLGKNPNVAAALVVGIGCELTSAEEIAKEIEESKKPTRVITLKQVGNYDKTIEKGRKIVREMLQVMSQQKREPAPLENLTLGIKCGGSDSTSGISGNIIVGKLVDNLVKEGGTAIFTETAEILGAENVLAKRAVDEEVANKIYAFGDRMECRTKAMGVDVRGSQPGPANIEGGLTTLEEKSLGAIAKSGSSPIQGALEWSERPSKKGLFFMDGSSCSEVFPGLAAAGAQILIYSIGGGLPAKMPAAPGAAGQFPIMPIIKLTGNPLGFEEIKDYIDIYVGSVLEGKETVGEAADRVYEEIIEIASGERKTVVESLVNYREGINFNIIGPLL